MTRQWLRTAVTILALVCLPALARAERYALIVSGASGGDEYAARYLEWTTELTTILVDRMKFDPARLAALSDTADASRAATAENVRKALGAVRESMGSGDLLFIVLIGHGTYDGTDAKFNLVGPDLESAAWLELLEGLPGQVVLVNTTGASFPFIDRLTGERRVIITATDSAAQQFDTVFPEYFIAAFRDEASDIDKNGRISIWEAFAAASGGVRRHFQQHGQLATERALLDDNGDGLGNSDVGALGATGAAIRPSEVNVETQAARADGSLASRVYLDESVPGARPTDEVLVQLLQRRAAVEAEVEELRIRRAFMPQEEYEKEFERLMIDLARVSREIRKRIKS